MCRTVFVPAEAKIQEAFEALFTMVTQYKPTWSLNAALWFDRSHHHQKDPPCNTADWADVACK
jgi:hypothetical protein